MTMLLFLLIYNLRAVRFSPLWSNDVIGENKRQKLTSKTWSKSSGFERLNCHARICYAVKYN